MLLFRENTPRRRNITRAVSSHSSHKPDLKLDFGSRCGYCNSSDIWKITYYEVDHFIPESILTTKSSTDYSNLVYSCRSCNNAKRKKWPTNDENVPNKNGVGFVDPCDDDYTNHFARKDNGEILFNTTLGEWMYHALKLYKPQHQIIWKLEQLEPIISDIKKMNDKVNIPEHLKDRIISVYDEFNDYLTQLRSL
ncbi:HNH endonuclease [Haliscomenobacter hydrossis]|uniref:HNH endonuclease n=1 Tax=Haliscomenobacter hydrossis (strain ATCC 27775 / DSM 1100 / LMG 10767 / O) TaxID=760192 RepID=F4KZS9_HALH1|nr:HNH endonuclease signature motif containing protein [Haliscomenobacter hydrossis]AEE50515.1 HNH endonuclease [Haliscomenobacter hydrossis DSM 1100]